MVDQLLQRGDGGQAAGGHLAAVLGPQRAADGVRVAEGRIDVVLELSQLAHQHLLHLDRQVLGQQRLCSSDNTSKQDRMLKNLTLVIIECTQNNTVKYYERELDELYRPFTN